MRLEVGATGWVEAPAGGALGFPTGRLAGIPPPPQGEAWVSPAAAAGRPAGPCALGSAHPAPSRAPACQCGPGLSRGDPAAARKMPGKAWSGGACLTEPGKKLGSRGPPWAPGQALAALPLCRRPVRSPLASAPAEPLRREGRGSVGHGSQGLGLLSGWWAAPEAGKGAGEC